MKTKAIDFLLRYIVFNVGPTLIELALVCVIVWSLLGGLYALIITATVLVYIVLTSGSQAGDCVFGVR